MNIVYMGQNVESVDKEEIALFHVQMSQSISVNYVDCGVITSHNVPIRSRWNIEKIGESNACTARTRYVIKNFFTLKSAVISIVIIVLLSYT